MTDVLAIALDADSRRHLGWALDAHARRCRENGICLPLTLVTLRKLATTGQGRTNIDTGEGAAHTAPVTTLLTFAEVAERLRVSERTVRRLAAEGALPTVDVASRRRVHLADLEAYAEGLRHQPGGVPA